MRKKAIVVCFILTAILALLFVFPLMKVSAEAGIIWDKAYGGTEPERGPSLVATSDGGYALAGYTGFCPTGKADFWLVKTDADGNMEWSQTYGGEKSDLALSLVVTSDGGYAIVGFTSSSGAGDNDFWLVKTDEDGNKEWDQTYGGTGDDRAYCIVVTSDGGYAIAGYTSSFGSGMADFWLVKTDEDGNKEWDQTYGGTREDYAYCLVITSDGGYAVAGETRSLKDEGNDFWLVKTDADGNMEWSQTYGETNYGGCARSLVVTPDGNYVIAGDSSANGESVDFCLVKTDASGNMIWQKTYGDGIEDRVSSLVQTSDGGYALTGFTSSFTGTDVWLGRTDADGNMEWSQTYGGTGNDAASSLVQTSDKLYVLAGDTTSFGAGDYDFWLVKTEAEDGTDHSPSDGEQPPPALALPTEYVYIGVAVVVIVVVLIGIVAYKKRK